MKSERKEDATSKLALEYSSFYGGKIGIVPKVPIRSLADFGIWYTPGVAAVSKRIQRDHDLAFEYTNKWNSLAILTDGTRVLGLGDIGPEASLPVMEGKALIYKYLGGVDAFPIPVRASSEEDFIKIAQAIEPCFGGINLEDISSPKCFEILERLRGEMKIPVWHDDQQGTAGIILAALYNALELTRRNLRESRIVFCGAGAANTASCRLLIEAGAVPENITMVDSKGVLHSEREDMDRLLLRNRWKYDLALKTNPGKVKGGLRDALKGVDVLIAASTPGPGVIGKEDVLAMAKKPIVFLLANPTPEMWPHDAKEAGAAVVATGRSDFPNQVNNSIFFPGVFRGVLDVRARTISDSMAIAAAKELARFAKEKGLGETNVVPTMLDSEVFPRVAAAIGMSAQKEGLAGKSLGRQELVHRARMIIDRSKETVRAMIAHGIIPSPPPAR
jgi:malate dehydrogenase (oxaloacetate-decarboxylating)